MDLNVAWKDFGQMLQQFVDGVHSWRRSAGHTHPGAARLARGSIGYGQRMMGDWFAGPRCLRILLQVRNVEPTVPVLGQLVDDQE